MRFHLKLGSIFTLSLFVFLFTSCDSGSKENQQSASKGRVVVPESELTFINESGEAIVSLNIAIADEPLERNQGLMDVRSMPENTGMLFIFDSETPQSFWMANTPLPLDIMYVNSDSVIVRIYQNTTPFSETSLPSEAPAIYVVETNGGYALTYGITEGMKIRF
ncbi:MAG: DUF192 domain-containing protein [Balneola sp.]|nr:MAG: DUF192 domain-containing protein [Balneola sp.]